VPSGHRLSRVDGLVLLLLLLLLVLLVVVGGCLVRKFKDQKTKKQHTTPNVPTLIRFQYKNGV
jgi:Na+-transporting methylmalonyl-CoA/oxaloacetate decarboxylase gamma subunit